MKPIHPFKLGDRVRYSKIYLVAPYKRYPEADEPFYVPRKIVKEIPEREGVICGIRRVALNAKVEFFDSGNDEYSNDHWDISPETWRMVYLVAPNLQRQDRVDEAWMVKA